MPEYTQALVSALEYQALLEVDRMLRLAIAMPHTGSFLGIAVEALDQVRRDLGLPVPDKIIAPEEQPKKLIQVSELANNLIKRAMS